MKTAEEILKHNLTPAVYGGLIHVFDHHLIIEAMEEYAKEEIMHFLQTVKLSDIMYKTREELLDIYLKEKQL